MIVRVFSLQDRKIGIFLNPMFLTSKGQAIRMVSDEINRPLNPGEQATTLQTHPEDIALYELGEFDTESGALSGNLAPVLIQECGELKR